MKNVSINFFFFYFEISDNIINNNIQLCVEFSHIYFYLIIFRNKYTYRFNIEYNVLKLCEIVINNNKKII